MAPYSEKELQYARPLAKAILESADFRAWLLAGTKFEKEGVAAVPIGEVQGALRSANLKNPYWFNYWCPRDSRCSCRIGTGIETDILLILKCGDGPALRHLALHIEVKRPGDSLRNGQAESYPRRASCWAKPDSRPGTVWPHDDFATFLVCDSLTASDVRAKYFDKILLHKSLRLQLNDYPVA